jgi:hypothetical protein
MAYRKSSRRRSSGGIKYKGKVFKSTSSLGRYKKYVEPKKSSSFSRSSTTSSRKSFSKSSSKKYVAYNNVTQSSSLHNSKESARKSLGMDDGWVDLQ